MPAPERKRRLSRTEQKQKRKAAKAAGAAGQDARPNGSQAAEKLGEVDAPPRNKKKKKSRPAEADPGSAGELPVEVDGPPHKKKKRKQSKPAEADPGIAGELPAEVDGHPQKKKKMKQSRPAEADPGITGELPAEATAAEQGRGRGGARNLQEVSAATGSGAASPEVASILRSLGDVRTPGTLSDRLNPTHPHFDAGLKDKWKSFTKKERAAIIECDRKRLAEVASSVVKIEHPFPVNEDDHCETAAEAYRDVAPVLAHLAQSLGKDRSRLRIYDPFYCAGAVVGHLNQLGFERVYNKCEDFYAVQREGRVPKHDVVVTNPPYSADHVERLLRWCRSNGRPFLLLMPNYCCAKAYYDEALDDRAATMLYLTPTKRYVYWTPVGLRSRDKVQLNHKGAGGNRCSPFISFWYISLLPAVDTQGLLDWWGAREGDTQRSTVLCRLKDLPRAVVAEEG